MVARPLVAFAGGFAGDARAQPDYRSGVRGGLVVHRGVDWDAAERGAAARPGALPQARYIVYYSIENDWWDSIDMAEALHPQTLLTMGMNDGDLPVGFGGPLRLRVPRQLGYKSVKYITRLTATDA